MVAGLRGEHAVPPLEGGLVGDAARLGRALDGDVVAHESDEGDPDGGRLPAALEDGAGGGGEPPSAGAAAPFRYPGRGGPVPPGARGAARRVPRHGLSEQKELVGGQVRHERSEGIRSSHIDLSHPPEHPSGGIVAKQRFGWVLVQILCLAGKSMAFGDPPVPELSPVI